MALALQPVIVSEQERFIEALNGMISINNAKFSYKRLTKASPLLSEILEVIDASVPKHFKENITTLQRSSSSSKDSPKSNANSMDYLKKIMEGDYGSKTKKIADKFDWNQTDLTKSPYFVESIHYLINYGGNVDIIEFFMKNNLIKFAIRYTLIQKIPYDMFVQFIIIPIQV